MGHLQARLVDALVPVEEEIQIERPGPAGRPDPDAAELGLDLEQQLEELSRAVGRFDDSRAVEETRLVGDGADRVGLVERRDAHDLDAGSRRQAIERTT